MAFEGAAADRSMDWPAPEEADWDAIYAEHLPRIYNYLRFRLAADADVEDLTARVFEKAWSARSSYRRPNRRPCNRNSATNTAIASSGRTMPISRSAGRKELRRCAIAANGMLEVSRENCSQRSP